jgi:hypothetical protein
MDWVVRKPNSRVWFNRWPNGYFAYVATTGLNTDNVSVGAGKMFTFHKGVFVDPKVVYDATAKTTNLQLGVGLKF